MNLKQYLAEDKEHPVSFYDSVEATEYLDDVLSRMKTKAVSDWVKQTDKNFDVNSKDALKAAIIAFEKFINELEKAQ